MGKGDPPLWVHAMPWSRQLFNIKPLWIIRTGKRSRNQELIVTNENSYVVQLSTCFSHPFPRIWSSCPRNTLEMMTHFVQRRLSEHQIRAGFCCHLCDFSLKNRKELGTPWMPVRTAVNPNQSSCPAPTQTPVPISSWATPRKMWMDRQVDYNKIE